MPLRFSESARYISHFSYPLIKEKLISRSEMEGFQINEIKNEFNSQRCTECGFTKNRAEAPPLVGGVSETKNIHNILQI